MIFDEADGGLTTFFNCICYGASDENNTRILSREKVVKIDLGYFNLP
jgi:hypothetical protein